MQQIIQRGFYLPVTDTLVQPHIAHAFLAESGLAGITAGGGQATVEKAFFGL